MSFYFPYNFYPVTGEISNGETTSKPRYSFDYDNTEDNDGNPTTALLARHDVWQEGRYSGYFEVTFINKTPMLVGNNHGNTSSIVSPYCWREKLALPANSLRGMISSIAETLSQSTLRILDKKYYPAFAEINTDLVPWKNGRNKLTPAEILFGVVDEEGSGSGDAQNLASRVRFSDAILQGSNDKALAKEQITLHELSSPKPDGVLPQIGRNQPDLGAYNHYFKLQDGTPASHQNVLDTSMKNLKPLGRKFYLNRNQVTEKKYRKYKGDDRCMKGRLINPEQKFKCKISFENLTNAELSLLKTSLQPSPLFTHHLGLGKSLGLGAMLIENITLTQIDRKQRYATNSLKNSKKTLLDITQYNNQTLIDEDTLKIIVMANNFLNLPPANTVHWRDGYNGREVTRPVPRLSPAQTELPLAEEVPETHMANNMPDTPKQTIEDKELEANNTEAGVWLRGMIVTLNNVNAYEELLNESIMTTIKGQSLSKHYMKEPESEKKKAILDLIHQEMEQRNIQRNELSAVVEKRYFPK